METRTRKEIIVFVAIAYSLAITLALATSFNFENPPIAILILSMSIPALSTLIMTAGLGSPVGQVNFKPSWTWILMALFLMPVSIHIITVPICWWSNGRHIPWNPVDAKIVVVSAFRGLAIVTFLAMFEEIGWRAWLMPRLMKVFNVRAAMVVGAVIWALWHLPFVFSGISSIEGLSMSQTLLVPLGTLGAGMVINWMWVNTRNFLVVSIAHGALNNWGQLAFKYISDSNHAVLLLVGVDAALLALGIITVMLTKPLLHNMPLPQPQP